MRRMPLMVLLLPARQVEGKGSRHGDPGRLKHSLLMDRVPLDTQYFGSIQVKTGGNQATNRQSAARD